MGVGQRVGPQSAAPRGVPSRTRHWSRRPTALRSALAGFWPRLTAGVRRQFCQGGKTTWNSKASDSPHGESTTRLAL